MPNTCSSLVPKNGSIAQHPFVARVEGFVKFDFSDRGVIVLVTNFSKADGPLAH